MNVRRIWTATRWAAMSAVGVALMLTRNCGHPVQSPPPESLVDMRVLQTAQAMSHLASTSDERYFSNQVLKLADHELDLAFSTALREAALHPVAETPETKELAARVNKAESQVKTDEDQVALFKEQISRVTGSHRDALQDQLDVLAAQLELDQDELDDAKGDLSRAGGDMVDRIRSVWEKHKAAAEAHGSNASPSAPTPNSAEAGYDAGNLIAQVAAWYSLSHKTTPLLQARQELLAGSNSLIRQHDVLEAHAATVAPLTRHQQDGKGVDSSESAVVAELTAVRTLSLTQRQLANVTQRIEDRSEMSGVYGEWIGFIQTRTLVAMTGVLRSTLWILLIILIAPPAAQTVERRMTKYRPEDQRWTSLSATTAFGMQALGVLLCLLVVFGFPQELPTAIFGLVGAGVTVALKDVAGVMVDNRVRELLNANPKPGVTSGDISQP